MEEDILLNELVKSDTAILAKAVGFDEICYNICDIRECCNGALENGKYHRNSKVNVKNPKFMVTIPTQSLLQKWLKDKKGLFVNADISPTNGQYEWYIHNVKKFGEAPYIMESDEYLFDTFEKALELGLLNALTILKDGEI